jgi:hypothetical protein
VTRLKQDLRVAGDDRGPRFKVHGKGTRAKLDALKTVTDLFT